MRQQARKYHQRHWINKKGDKVDEPKMQSNAERDAWRKSMLKQGYKVVNGYYYKDELEAHLTF